MGLEEVFSDGVDINQGHGKKYRDPNLDVRINSQAGIQRLTTTFTDGSKLRVTGTFGIAPLKIVVHP